MDAEDNTYWEYSDQELEEQDLEIEALVRQNSQVPTLSKLRRAYEIDLSEYNKIGECCYKIIGQEDFMEYMLKIDLAVPMGAEFKPTIQPESNFLLKIISKHLLEDGRLFTIAEYNEHLSIS